MQDEKNQILTTNVWLNLVSPSHTYILFPTKLKYFSSRISSLSVLFSSNVAGRSLHNFCIKWMLRSCLTTAPAFFIFLIYWNSKQFYLPAWSLISVAWMVVVSFKKLTFSMTFIYFYIAMLITFRLNDSAEIFLWLCRLCGFK